MELNLYALVPCVIAQHSDNGVHEDMSFIMHLTFICIQYDIDMNTEIAFSTCKLHCLTHANIIEVM